MRHPQVKILRSKDLTYIEQRQKQVHGFVYQWERKGFLDLLELPPFGDSADLYASGQGQVWQIEQGFCVKSLPLRSHL